MVLFPTIPYGNLPIEEAAAYGYTENKGKINVLNINPG